MPIKKVLFLGSKQLGVKVLSEMYFLSPETLIGIITIDDRNDTRSTLDDFREFSKKNKIPFFVANNREHLEEIIRGLKPELCFVCGWYWLISKNILDSVPHGFIGIHNSLLPKYRGGAPLIWSIINGEKEVGFSIFSFTPGMDDGPIWAQGSFKLEEVDYISDVLKKLEQKTVAVLRDKYLPILTGTLRPIEQPHHEATYCAQRYPADGNINWQQSAREIYNFIRSQSEPYPGAFTYWGSRMLKVWRARPFNFRYYGTPGQVARISSEDVYVICGDNRAIILEEVEKDGRKGKAGEFVQSIQCRFSNMVK